MGERTSLVKALFLEGRLPWRYKQRIKAFVELNKRIFVFRNIKKLMFRRGIKISSIRFFNKQGAMSKLFILTSNKGKFLIQFMNQISEQSKQKLYLKLLEVSKLLSNHKIPNKKIFFGGVFGKEIFIVSEFVEGITLEDDGNKDYIKQVNNMLRKIHNVKLRCYGYLMLKDGELQGTHNSWYGFLRKSSFSWLQNYSSLNPDFKYLVFKKKLELFFEKHKSKLNIKPGKFVHGDFNPRNIIVKDGKIVSVLDFEWAMSGDPAWDLIETEFNLGEYLKKVDNDFKFRIKLYTPLKFLFKANNVSEMKLFDLSNKEELREKYINNFKREINDLLK